MHNIAKPAMRPARPQFSSGPTVKHPGWRLENLQAAPLGRSHRSKVGKGRLKEAIDRTREVLEVPDDFLIGIVPASDTGAVEMAMWSMLGPLPVQVAAWESFSKDWVVDIIDQLKLPGAEELTAPFGQLPDLSKVRPDGPQLGNALGVLLAMKTRAGYSHEHISIAGCKRAHRAAEQLLRAARERRISR